MIDKILLTITIILAIVGLYLIVNGSIWKGFFYLGLVVGISIIKIFLERKNEN